MIKSTRSLAMVLAMSAIATSDLTSNNVPKEQPKQPKTPKHPFHGVGDKLFSMLLEDPYINYEDIFNINKNYIFVPMEMIPMDDAMSIVRYISSNDRRKCKNMQTFEVEAELFGNVQTVRTIATNMKNANKKLERKAFAIIQLKK